MAKYMWVSFVEFIKNYQVMGLAVAVIIGGKVNALVSALVDQLIMPFVGILIHGGDWRQIAFHISNAKFGIGIFLGATLDFVLVALIIFMLVKLMTPSKPS